MYSIYSSGAKTNIARYKRMVYFESTLAIETYIIGYKSEGEVILFFVRADGGISFSGLVDCYKLDDIDKVSEILKYNNIQTLDFICWTHPDSDHSIGLKEIIDSYVSDKTYIWIPEGVDAQEIKCGKKVQELFSYLKECSINMDSSFNVYSASDRKDLLCYNSVCFQKGTEGFPLEMISYAPNSKIIRKQNYLDEFIKNDRSIFFTLALGNVRIFLTGDVENETVECIPREFFGEHVHIMKIPHHGSETSTRFLELGWDRCDIACATVYRRGRSNLPECEIMNQYKENTEHLFCTGKANKDDEQERYGVLKVVTDILQNTYSMFVEGNAEIWSA